MQAITMAANTLGGKYLIDCSLYVTVEPCVMCAGALGWSQIGKVVFGASDEKRGYQRFAPLAIHPKTEVVAGVLQADCAHLMSSFFKKEIKRVSENSRLFLLIILFGHYKKSSLVA
jgi:tRNA(adenine34) deaminase